uniref:collagen alpha-1(I) chain-like isoform X2 n=1 Tax=Halichoerus grypus TaxID=9711 RepID=UPI0016596AAE|nr:collagen alpha-1(I) chain-like isoform X2 [Halichoerus grypus]XP_035940976.1 collagen alpha-1(I) chain-like isoform X2 [Halichoerus grypus]XP_035940977.1 collagen alpha-1(I) chain-like isoform X2 [Halichoerus grypus]
MAAALLLLLRLPPSFPGCRWGPGADGRPESPQGTAPQAGGWSRILLRGAADPGASRAAAPALASAGRGGQTGAISRRLRLGRWRLLRARREEGRRRRSRGGRGGRRAAARVPGRRPRGRPWPGEASTTSAGSAAGSDPAPDTAAPAGTTTPHCQAGPREPVAKGHGDARGLEAPPDSDRRLPRGGKPPSRPGPDPSPIPAAYPGLGAQVWLSPPVTAGPEGLLAGERATTAPRVNHPPLDSRSRPNFTLIIRNSW